MAKRPKAPRTPERRTRIGFGRKGLTIDRGAKTQAELNHDIDKRIIKADVAKAKSYNRAKGVKAASYAGAVTSSSTSAANTAASLAAGGVNTPEPLNPEEEQTSPKPQKGGKRWVEN